ncbi:MAG: hypothetical protein ACO1NZ_07320 [Adhaeribacter sp.]
MPKLFIFGIGGTGSRVIRSLTMLLAAGAQIKNCDKIIPIIIDPDAQNGDMNRTVELLKVYRRLHKHLGSNRPDGFFKTDISTLSSLANDSDGAVQDTFVFDFGGINQRFRDYIHYNTLAPGTKSVVDLLFTEDNLDSPLTIGFRGSPNVGSVVLNKLVDSAEIQYFAKNFQKDDRIFFVSSIFGGTGAAGFPLLLKNLKDDHAPLANAGYIQDALTGAITVLPYFALQAEDGSVIDSNTFITKTRAALSYYEQHLNRLEALYYIADTPDAPYQNQPGGSGQQNKAHIIELLSAMAVLDFMDYDRADLGGNTVYHEYGLSEDAQEVEFGHLSPESREKIADSLSRFLYFSTYFNQYLKEDKDSPYYKNLELHNLLGKDSLFKDLDKLINSADFGFLNWLKELSHNRRAFSPFNLGTEDFNRLIRGKEINTKAWNPFDKGISHGFFRNELDSTEKKLGEPDKFRKFITLFEQATRKAYDEKVRTV